MYLVAVMPSAMSFVGLEGGVYDVELEEREKRKYQAVLEDGLRRLSGAGYTARGEVVVGEAIDEIRRLRPELPVLLISGLSLEGLSREVAEDPRTYLLHKPYRFVQLQEALEEALSPSLA